MTNYNPTQCESYKFLIMKSLDDEITSEEKRQLEIHLSECAACRQEYQELTELKGVTHEVKKRMLPEMAWEEYWQHLYNRLERGVGWILISIGAIILFGIGVYQFVAEILRSTQISGLEKFGILALSLGFVVLFISVLREKLMARRHDNYKEIQR